MTAQPRYQPALRTALDHATGLPALAGYSAALIALGLMGAPTALEIVLGVLTVLGIIRAAKSAA